MQEPRFLEWQFYHNSVRAWLVAGIAFLVIGGALFLIRTLLARRLAAMAERTATSADDAVVDLIKRTRYFFILAAAIAGATLFLDLPRRALDIGKVLATIAVILQIAIWGNGLITYAFSQYAEQKADSDISSRTTIAAFSFVARAILWSMLALVALNRLGYDITALITGLGVGGIALALAVQNILGDLFAALAIVVDKPFVVGDTISVDTLVGTVEHIGLKTTRVRSVNGEQLIFSNADLLKSRIRNLKRMQERRVLFLIGVTYDTPPDVVARIPAIIRDAIEAQSPVRFDRSHFSSYGESALNFESVYFVLSSDYLTYMDINQAVNLTLLRRFAAEGIQFAYPTRMIHVQNQVAAAELRSTAGDTAGRGPGVGSLAAGAGNR
jgi:small-conductance mechanosensitive channel